MFASGFHQYRNRHNQTRLIRQGDMAVTNAKFRWALSSTRISNFRLATRIGTIPNHATTYRLQNRYCAP
jgi:hypothetical protein